MPLFQVMEALRSCGASITLAWMVNTDLMLMDFAGDGFGVGAQQPRTGLALVSIFGAFTLAWVAIEAAHRLALQGRATGVDVELRKREWARLQVQPLWQEGIVVGVYGQAVPIPAPAETPAEAFAHSLEVVAELTRPVPEARAAAGDRVIFRPGHQDPARRCLVEHPAEPALFAHAEATGALEVIAARGAPTSSVRGLLRRWLARPQRHLALARP